MGKIQIQWKNHDNQEDNHVNFLGSTTAGMWDILYHYSGFNYLLKKMKIWKSSLKMFKENSSIFAPK